MSFSEKSLFFRSCAKIEGLAGWGGFERASHNFISLPYIVHFGMPESELENRKASGISYGGASRHMLSPRPVMTNLAADLGEREAGCRSSCRADSSLRSSDTRAATAAPTGLRRRRLLLPFPSRPLCSSPPACRENNVLEKHIVMHVMASCPVPPACCGDSQESAPHESLS